MVSMIRGDVGPNAVPEPLAAARKDEVVTPGVASAPVEAVSHEMQTGNHPALQPSLDDLPEGFVPV